MRKLPYEAPELRIALTEYQIKANNPMDASGFENGGQLPGEEITESDD